MFVSCEAFSLCLTDTAAVCASSILVILSWLNSFSQLKAAFIFLF